MGKHLQDKLLDAGVIPHNAVKQMEQWQSVPAGSSDRVGEFSQDKVRHLREDVELQALPAFKETLLDVDKLMKKGRHVTLFHEGAYALKCWAGVDILKRYIFQIPSDAEQYKQISGLMRPLSFLLDDSSQPPLNRRMVSEVSVLYETVEDGVSIPTHWLCVTQARGEETLVRAR